MQGRSRILFVSTSYPQTAADWQGTFIRNLLFALAESETLDIRYWGPPGELPRDVRDVGGRDAAWLDALRRRGGIAQSLKRGGLAGLQAAVMLLTRLRRVYRANADVDVYHVNWLQNALPLLGVPGPVVVSCLGTDYALLKHGISAGLLNRVLGSRRTVVVPNATWMEPGIRTRLSSVRRVEPVYFGVDRGWFDVRHVAETPARWLAVLRITRNKIGYLLDWGRHLAERNAELHLFGPMQEDIGLPDWVHYHGPATPDDLRDHWFPRATGLVSLSTHDEGLPQVMLEALAAGLPVLASRIPGHEAVLAHARTGWLAGTEQEFIAGLAWLSDPGNNRAAGEAGRRWALDKVGTWRDCAQRYIALYQTLLDDRK